MKILSPTRAIRNLSERLFDKVIEKSLCHLNEMDADLLKTCTSHGFDFKEVLTSLDDVQKFTARYCARTISNAIKGGYINPKEIKSACDFGCGDGVTTFLVKKTLGLPDEKMLALEKDSFITRKDILGKTKVIDGDGTAFLKKGTRKFDLVTACLLGPIHTNSNYGLLKQLLLSVPNSLTDKGKLLVYSDLQTMDMVTTTLKTNKIKFTHVKGDAPTKLVPIIISRDELVKLNEGMKIKPSLPYQIAMKIYSKQLKRLER
ncbi:MAG: hypothetical protein GX568_09450 [Candidatus Gastranaerophilales bacterium]|nr:hypothetical protein [Candidatus Gastranaerophilales bacterium]